MSRNSTETRESGFTIVELLIYMAMFVVVLGAMYSLMISNTKSYSSQESRVEMTQDLRSAMNLMVREIRMAGCDPQDIDTVGFVDDADDRYDTDANSIHFTEDIDADGAIATAENINYYLDTAVNNIKRRTGGGGVQPVAENITALTFSYRFADGDTGIPDEGDADTTNDLEDIRRVQIAITGETANVDAVTGVKKTRTQSAWVVIRNAGVD